MSSQRRRVSATVVQSEKNNYFNCESGYVGHFDCGTGHINNLKTEYFDIETLGTKVFDAGTGFINSIVTNSVNADQGEFIEVKGLSSHFTSSVNTYLFGNSGVFKYFEAGTGHFTTLSAENFDYPHNESLNNLQIKDTLTGINIYSDNISCGTGIFHNLISNGITGSGAYLSDITCSSMTVSQTLTGSDAYWSDITCSSITVSQTLTGSDAYWSDITCSSMTVSQTLTGSDAYLSDLTCSSITVSQTLTGSEA